MKTGYYVNVADGYGNNYRMRGPYSSREAAEAAVIPVSREADTIDPRSSFMSWGVAKMEAPELPLGRLGGAS